MCNVHNTFHCDLTSQTFNKIRVHSDKQCKQLFEGFCCNLCVYFTVKISLRGLPLHAPRLPTTMFSHGHSDGCQVKRSVLRLIEPYSQRTNANATPCRLPFSYPHHTRNNWNHGLKLKHQTQNHHTYRNIGKITRMQDVVIVRLSVQQRLASLRLHCASLRNRALFQAIQCV
jgi:hypothetical protein